MSAIELSTTNQRVIEKLAQMAGEFEALVQQMNDPAISCNHKEIARISKAHGQLKQIVEDYYKFQTMQSQWAEAREMLDDPDTDDEMREMAQEELTSLEGQIAKNLETTKEKLVMSTDAVVGSVIIEIRAGTGGDEAALFAGNLFTMYQNYAAKRHWKVEMMSFSSSAMGGYKEVIIGIKGDGVWGALGYEGGGHRVQRVPETESQGRIHTSAATVAVLPEPEEVDINIKKDEVLEHVCRSSGPGGQSVNKLNSAIKLEHIPTGITVSMQDEKSQHKNRAKAWRILRSRIYDKIEQERRAERRETRQEMIGSGDRSQRIRTYNFPQNRVTDHRINLSLYSLDKAIMGDIDELISGMVEHDKQQRLANL